MKSFILSTILTLPLLFTSPSRSEEKSAVERGREALLGRSFNPPTLKTSAYDNVWKQWGLKEKPEDYDRAFRERYGLHPAPYPNGKYPMGVREDQYLFIKGLTTDCMICHGGSIMGKSHPGLGNSSLDYQAFVLEMARASGQNPKSPFVITRTRGTMEAGAMSVYLMGYRNPDLSLRTSRIDLGLFDDLCEDVPAWWHLKKKKTIYHTGGANAHSVRALMQFMMSPLNSASTFKKEEATFRDIQAYLRSLEPPEYPFEIDRNLAAKGEKVFTRNCAKCHGTYGEDWTYPNRVVPLEEIGTDPNRYRGITKKFADYYNRSWFSQESSEPGERDHKGRITKGYQAPPLDGVWATAPYFHNGSAPTVYHVLKSGARPKLFTRSFRTGKEDYDPVKIGWRITELKEPASEDLPPIEQRKVFDTSRPGRSNKGHTFGDKLTEEERMAVLEYLKTL